VCSVCNTSFADLGLEGAGLGLGTADLDYKTVLILSRVVVQQVG